MAPLLAFSYIIERRKETGAAVVQIMISLFVSLCINQVVPSTLEVALSSRKVGDLNTHSAVSIKL